jgi:hypothetical protein
MKIDSILPTPSKNVPEPEIINIQNNNKLNILINKIKKPELNNEHNLNSKLDNIYHNASNKANDIRDNNRIYKK